MRTTSLRTALLLLLATATSNLLFGQSKIIIIRAGRLLDTQAGTVATNQFILIENDTIKTVSAQQPTRANAQLIDLSNATVLPGLIDCHVHVSGQPGGNYYENFLRRTAIDYAVVAHKYVRRTLEAGFTTCRDLGSSEFIAASLRDAINRGDIPGPRLLVANYYIGSTGSHGDLNGFSPWLTTKVPAEMSGVADGVEGVRKKVRYNIKYGADVIKMGASAGVLSEEESVGAPQYTQAEMDALVDEARMWGRRVAAHAHGTEAIKMAVKAGVASIEHGSFLDDEAIQLMKQHGTYLVADIYNDDYILSEYKKLGVPDKILDKERAVGLRQRQSFQKAAQAGVKMAFGTDAGVFPHGDNAKQFAYMVKWGLTPMLAIQSATSRAAELLGWSQKVGTIAPGKLADIIAVATDPLQNITALETVGFVMKGGVVFKNELRKP